MKVLSDLWVGRLVFLCEDENECMNVKKRGPWGKVREYLCYFLFFAKLVGRRVGGCLLFVSLLLLLIRTIMPWQCARTKGELHSERLD